MTATLAAQRHKGGVNMQNLNDPISPTCFVRSITLTRLLYSDVHQPLSVFNQKDPFSYFFDIVLVLSVAVMP